MGRVFKDDWMDPHCCHIGKNLFFQNQLIHAVSCLACTRDAFKTTNLAELMPCFFGLAMRCQPNRWAAKSYQQSFNNLRRKDSETAISSSFLFEIG
jgi:hypothetical protein